MARRAAASPSVDAFLAALDHPFEPAILRLRDGIVAPDPHGRLRWPARDRDVLTLASREQAAELEGPAQQLVRGWLERSGAL